MAIKGLTLDEMAHVTATMLAPESVARATIAASPLLAALLALMDAAHSGVMKALPRPEDPRLKALVLETLAVDAVHDSLVGSLHSYLGALSELSEDGARFSKLQGELFPEGVSGTTQVTFEGQAGYAKRLRERLTADLQAQLSQIPAGSKTLMELVNDWLDAGDRLGQLGQEQQQLKAATPEPTRGSIQQARLKWIQALNALRSLAPLADLNEAQEERIFSTLNEVEAKADLRSARRRASKLEASIEADVAEAAEEVGRTSAS
jgi:hypothetical protein